eukprot:CAMPEP_0202968332 /NCGR_PEP_ID=MMETSP1396-20130829/13596_1 /ASSEMBLY_ACC=CAM_ASM_000872 /TAXON_ID= /ORGANISM="Pseudokeronopsis sp., Strain Brazil" /LENGTH=113 /DNA_ID=CAMNT_0049694525 /DNA_START=416 /DNA_END=752 /DNA_ORIENTATION=-
MLVNLGSICILMSFGALKGFYAYFVNELIFGDKKLYSIGYILSLAASTYASLIIKNYLLTIACLAIEVVFMLYFICSSFPLWAKWALFPLPNGRIWSKKMLKNLNYLLTIACL